MNNTSAQPKRFANGLKGTFGLRAERAHGLPKYRNPWQDKHSGFLVTGMSKM